MSPAAERKLGPIEFTAVMAAAMSIAALGIDLLLPAFPAIRADLGLSADSTAVAGIITTYFIGMAVGQPIYGPASDSFGRLPIMRLGFGVYIVGALLSVAAPTLPLLMAARLLMGIGAAGPRTVTIAMVRDRFEGEQMSRQMSIILSVFMIVPVVAPALGALGASIAPWRWLLVACIAAAVGTLLWSLRMAESLAPEHRRPLRLRALGQAARTVLTTRATVGNMIAMTALYGVLTSYLGTSEIIFAEVFDQGAAFPLLFGGLAVVMTIGMLGNARVVERLGSRLVANVGLVTLLVGAALLFLAQSLSAGAPPLWLYMALMSVILFAFAIVVPNLNSMAMVPMGGVAGMASAVIGAIQTGVGAMLGALVDQRFDGTLLPFAAATLLFGVVAVIAVMVGERRPLTLRRPAGTTEPTPSAAAQPVA